MSNKDLEILTLWETLSEREKKEVVRRLKQKQESGKSDLKRCSSSASERQRRQLRPIWQLAFDTVKGFGIIALVYVFVVATLLIA